MWKIPERRERKIDENRNERDDKMKKKIKTHIKVSTPHS